MTHIFTNIHVSDNMVFRVKWFESFATVEIGQATIFLVNREQAAKLAQAANQASQHLSGKED